MAACDPSKERLQWQDGVGNILVCDESSGSSSAGGASQLEHNRNIKVTEVDAAWALGVAGFVILFIVALCFMAKCRLSLFTRRAKKKIGRAASEKKKRGLAGAEAKAAEAAAAASAAPKPLSKKKELLIDMIDSMLGEDTGEEVLYCSLESIDRLGDGQETALRRASQGSIALSLVFDNEKSRPVFMSKSSKADFL